MEWLRLRLADQEGGADTWRELLAWIDAPPTGQGPAGTASSRARAIREQAERTALSGKAALEAGGY